MTKTVLETLSKKEIIFFGLVLFVGLSAFFVIGGSKGADPATANIHIANLFVPKVKDYEYSNDANWVWYRPQKNNSKYKYKDGNLFQEFIKLNNGEAKNMVFATKIPHPGKHYMHKEFQFMLVIMSIQMEYRDENVKTSADIKKTHECVLEFSAKLAYSDVEKPENQTDWKLLTRVENQARPLTCKFMHLEHHKKEDGQKIEDGYYICDDQHLFELGSVAHKHYLLNIKFPVSSEKNRKCLASNSSFFNGVHLTEIHQNGGYTISLFVSKTVMFPFIVGALLFFLKRVKREARPMMLLEKATASLGVALTVLLLPIDWFTLVFDMPYMLFLSDLRQGLFYAALLIFWCIFAGEHMLDSSNTRDQISSYKWEIGCISVGCLGFFIFDLVERGVQLANPFHTIWKKDSGETVAKVIIGCAITAAIIYAIFFARLLFYVYRQVRQKEVALPAMQEERRRHYQNLIYRWRVLIWVTVFTVFATVICFVLDQLNETAWKFEEGSVNDYVIVSSAMHFGMFGMWGIYVFAVLILYSPSGKTSESSSVYYRASTGLMDGDNDEDEDEINFRHAKK